MRITSGSKSFTPQRIFCIGMNYVEHIHELHDNMPEKPVIFMKPATCLVKEGTGIHIPTHGKVFHYEVELVLLLGKDGKPKTKKEALSFIEGVSLGFDLTMRDVQRYLLPKGLPWELSKAFDQSAPVGKFVPAKKIPNLQNIKFSCSVNGDLKQNTTTKNMIFPVETLIMEIATAWKLNKGDLIYTGTPHGIGPLTAGDTLTAESPAIGRFSWKIIL